MGELDDQELCAPAHVVSLDGESAAAERWGAHEAIWCDPIPAFSLGTDVFWASIARGVFQLGQCLECAHVYFPPRVICPNCWAADRVALVPTDGAGVVFTFSRLHVVAASLRSLAPIVMACVDLPEGVRLLTWVLGDSTALARGAACVVGVETIAGKPRFVARLTSTE